MFKLLKNNFNKKDLMSIMHLFTATLQNLNPR